MGTIGEVIARHHSEIVRLWMQTAEQSPSARELSGRDLASTIPAYLSLFAKQDEAQLSDVQRQLIEHHMSSRLRAGFNLNEILTEFASLARYVVKFIDEVESPLSDGARLARELLMTSTEVTKIFNEQLLEDEQTLKRYLRLLQNIAGETGEVHQHEPPLRELLTKALALIMEAMGAQTAALLLFDAKSDELIMSAATGDAHEHLAEHVSAHDTATWAGKIASVDDEAIAVADAETTELEVTETLRQSGIHALLGIRLSAHHLLRGVLYVGTRQKRAFSASKMRRLEKLGEALTIHLDSARLHAALREQIDQGAVADEMRERFISVLMHDLREPLTSARATARQLVAGASPVPAAETIMHQLDRMQHMIDDLLEAHRIRAGESLRLHVGACNLSAVAREVVDELSSVYGNRFVLRAGNPVRGMWDADRLRRALWSLAANAIKHGDRDAPVTISVEAQATGAELGVHNAGRSIYPDQQARLFRPFSRERLRSHKPGWGIGLLLVWGCAEAHGGYVDVKSAAGEGTTFTLCLPWDARPYAIT